jgi:heme/copper-type cytochrome/quinol oxidase subunit 1
MTISGLFLMGSTAIFLLGGFNNLLTQTLAVRVPLDTPPVAQARLQYLFVGVAVFLAAALLHLREDEGETSDVRLSKMAFWLMFVGFNLAFFPTTLRRSQAFLSDPLRLLPPAVGSEVTAGVLLFVAGTTLCLWSRAAVRRATRP